MIPLVGYVALGALVGWAFARRGATPAVDKRTAIQQGHRGRMPGDGKGPVHPVGGAAPPPAALPPEPPPPQLPPGTPAQPEPPTSPRTGPGVILHGDCDALEVTDVDAMALYVATASRALFSGAPPDPADFAEAMMQILFSDACIPLPQDFETPVGTIGDSVAGLEATLQNHADGFTFPGGLYDALARSFVGAPITMSADTGPSRTRHGVYLLDGCLGIEIVDAEAFKQWMLKAIVADWPLRSMPDSGSSLMLRVVFGLFPTDDAVWDDCDMTQLQTWDNADGRATWSEMAKALDVLIRDYNDDRIAFSARPISVLGLILAGQEEQALALVERKTAIWS